MKPSSWFTTVQPEMIWGTFVFFKPVEPGVKSKAIWWNEEIGTWQKLYPIGYSVANGCADSQRLNHKQTGDLQLSLEFGVAPVTNITVLVYGEFENLLEIDSNGAVLYDIYQH